MVTVNNPKRSNTNYVMNEEYLCVSVHRLLCIVMCRNDQEKLFFRFLVSHFQFSKAVDSPDPWAIRDMG